MTASKALPAILQANCSSQLGIPQSHGMQSGKRHHYHDEIVGQRPAVVIFKFKGQG